MRKLLLTTTAIVGFSVSSAEEAKADPVSVWVAGTVFNLTAGSAAFAIVAGTVSLALNIGATLLLRKFAGRNRPRADQIRAELRRPQSLPSYRFVYGRTWAPGTPVIWKVEGEVLFLCYMLNSRPSAGPDYTLFLDKRRVVSTGNPFDFSGPGASAASGSEGRLSGHLRYWIGDGSQTTAPDDVVSGSLNAIMASDAWRGCTVLWMRLEAGADEDFRERWPSTPPEVNVEANWSIVADPRTGTSGFSRNPALAVLDALRNNPLTQYQNANLDLGLFSEAADVCDELLPTLEGSWIPKFRCDGVLVFSEGSELEDQLQPLLESAAMQFTRIGGRLGLVPAAMQLSQHTISEVADFQGMELVRWAPSDQVYSEGQARFPSPDRSYEMSTTPLYIATDGRPQDLAWEFNPSAGTCKLWAGSELIAEGSGTFTEWSGATNGGYGVPAGNPPVGVPTTPWGPDLGQLEIYENQTLPSQFMAGPYINTVGLTPSFTYQKGEIISFLPDRTTPVLFVARGVKFPMNAQNQLLFELGGGTQGCAVWATSDGEIGVRCGSGGALPRPDAAWDVKPFVGSQYADAREVDGGVPNRLTVDLDFVSDYRQAEYVLKIMTERSRMQRSASFEALPDAFDLVAGAVCRFEPPAPFRTWSGKYKVESLEPAAGLNGDDSISIRLPIRITEEKDWTYSWSPQAEEKALVEMDLDQYSSISPPVDLSVYSGITAARLSGDETVPAVAFVWEASTSAITARYEWQWRRSVNGVMETGWHSGGVINQGAADSDGLYQAQVDWVVIGEDYQFRARSWGGFGHFSDASPWANSPVITATGPEQVVPPPSNLSATAVSDSQIDISATQSNSTESRAILIYYNDFDNPLTSTLLTTMSATANVQVNTAHTGLGSEETWYYFARSRDQWGNLSDFTPSASATTL